VYRREDGRWGWRLYCLTGRAIATDGGDGYNDRATAVLCARELLAGELDVVVEDDPVLAGTGSATFASWDGGSNGHALHR
jgi:hypothetical protein